jgi:hypothetical protein
MVNDNELIDSYVFVIADDKGQRSDTERRSAEPDIKLFLVSRMV